MVHLLHPMLVMIKDKTCGYKFLDQGPFVLRLDQLVGTLTDNPEVFLQKDYVAFPGDQFQAVRARHARWLTKDNNSTLIDALFSPQTGASYGVMEHTNSVDVDSDSDNENDDEPQSLDEMVLVFLRAYGTKLHERIRKGDPNPNPHRKSKAHPHLHLNPNPQACGPVFFQVVSTPT